MAATRSPHEATGRSTESEAPEPSRVPARERAPDGVRHRVVHWARRYVVAPVRDYFDDHCPQLASAIAYWALFSVFPLAILLVAAAGVVVPDTAARDRLIDVLLTNVPLSSRGRDDLESILDEVLASSGAIGILGVPTLVWTASGLMAAVRTALNIVWEADDTRPILRAKLVDLLLVLTFGLFVALSVAGTAAVRFAADVATGSGVLPRVLEWAANASVWSAQILVPFLLSFLGFLVLFRFVPATSPPLRQAVPGALVAAAFFEATKHGFALYVEHVADYNAVYGSLGTIVAFLFFAYVSASLFLVAAEFAAALPDGRRRESAHEPRAAETAAAVHRPRAEERG